MSAPRPPQPTAPRLKQRYDDEIRGPAQGDARPGNIMQVPRLEKIVVNMGVGAAIAAAVAARGRRRATSRIITGQKPVVTKAKKSIAGFKLREGNAIGAKVTLRGDRMWEFFDRLISLAIPRIRDFRGLPPNGVRRPRQLHVRRHRAADLPGDRLRQGRHHPGHGHHHRHHRPHRCRGQGPARRLRLPVPSVRDSSSMAKKALIEKQQRKPKFKVRAYTRCRAAAGRARCTASSGSAASACASWCTPASSPA